MKKLAIIWAFFALGCEIETQSVPFDGGLAQDSEPLIDDGGVVVVDGSVPDASNDADAGPTYYTVTYEVECSHSEVYSANNPDGSVLSRRWGLVDILNNVYQAKAYLCDPWDINTTQCPDDWDCTQTLSKDHQDCIAAPSIKTNAGHWEIDCGRWAYTNECLLGVGSPCVRYYDTALVDVTKGAP